MLLKSKSCSIIFDTYRSKLIYAYFGKSFANEADFKSLLQNPWHYATETCYPLQLTYPAFGDDTLDRVPADGTPMAGMDPYGALSVIHADGVTSTVLDFISAKTKEETGARTIVIKLKDNSRDFFVTQYFKAYDDCDVFETWIELTNNENGAVKLPSMDTFAMDLNGRGSSAELFSLASHWAAEGLLSHSKIALGTSASIQSRNGIHSAWEANPAFMVGYGETTETTGRVFGGALAWTGAWHANVSVLNNGAISVHAGAVNPSGPYVLDSGKTLTLPKFIFTWSENGRGEISRELHRWARNHALPHGKELRPILLNSWEGCYFTFTEKTLTDMMDGVKDFGGEMFVIDDGWFGRGEFARNNDTCGLGDWYWNYEKLPNGPEYIAEEAKKRGLRLGLWFEPEMANTKSDLITKHPDWIISEPGRETRLGRGRTQVVLDLCNPAVRDEIFRQIDEILTAVPYITYIKWDANAAFTNAGSPYLDKEHQPNLWFDYAMGYYDLATRLAGKHPHVFFQACASGGGHIDYGTLSSYADEAWGSDNTDAPTRVLIQWGEMQFYPANSIACHVTASPNHGTRRPCPIKYRFDVAMSGRLGFELHPGNITDKSEIPFIKDAVETYKRIRPVIQQGDLYRLVSPYDGDYASIIYVSEDKKRAVLFYYGLARGICKNYIPFVQLKGLDADTRYKIKEINLSEGNLHANFPETPIGGDALMTMGVSVRLGSCYDSAVFELTAVSP